jgi:hypothetical protein
MNKFQTNNKLSIFLLVFVILGSLVFITKDVSNVHAVTNPQNGAIGLEGTINSPPPTQAATIAIPANGQNFTSSPITVSGLCKDGLLIEVFDNNIFAGSTECSNSSYGLKISLFNGTNSLVSRDYDALNQRGPDSNTVTITYTSAQFIAFGTQLTLESNYSQLGANPGSQLSWPITINGGTSPYALSIDWGDGTPSTLMSVVTAGPLSLTHTYQLAGTYTVTVQATDKNGQPAFLQVVSVISGPIHHVASSTTSSSTTKTEIVTISIWAKIAMLCLLILIIIAFWVGRRYELIALRHKIDKSNRNDL